MQLIPALDLLGDYAVRLEQGDYERVIFRQPIATLLDRLVLEKPPLIHIVDLEGARDGALRTEVIARCVERAHGIPLQISGGLRTIESARRALATGASRVIIGTAVWATSTALHDFVAALSDRLVVAVDVKDAHVAIRGWRDSSGLSVDEALRRCVETGVTRLHVTAVDRDGTMRGPDLDLYRRACESGLAVVAAGGVRDDRDLEKLEAIGCEGAVMGVGYLVRLGIDPTSRSFE